MTRTTTIHYSPISVNITLDESLIPNHLIPNHLIPNTLIPNPLTFYM